MPTAPFQIIESHVRLYGKNIWTRLIFSKEAVKNPTIVLLHDALGSVAQWKGFPEELARYCKCNVLIYDRPGHGLSDPEEKANNLAFFEKEAYIILPALLNEFQLKDVILYGHSDGGSIALLYASRYPLFALIAEAAHVYIEDKTVLGVARMKKEATNIKDLLHKYHGSKADFLFDHWSTNWTDPKNRSWSIEDVLEQIKAPVLIIQGNEDDYASYEQVHRIASKISGEQEILFLEDVNHFPYKEQPGLVLNKVKSFLAKYLQ